jgi:hypothetical protein
VLFVVAAHTVQAMDREDAVMADDGHAHQGMGFKAVVHGAGDFLKRIEENTQTSGPKA